MGRAVGLLLLTAALLVGWAVPTGASTRPPKVVLFYGDSLVFESMPRAVPHFGSGYKVVTRASPGTAPCAWVSELSNDLATYTPWVVVLATAGNGGGCEQNAIDSPQFLADYQHDLTTFAQTVTATSAQLVFVEDPPFLDTARNDAGLTIDNDEAALSTSYPHITVFTTARKHLATRAGAYETYARCLTTETAAQGCDPTTHLIAVRTTSGPDEGLHLCPDNNIGVFGCDEYSSGEVRFGKDLAVAAKHPSPVIP